MRYCVRYRVEEKNWVVADVGNDNQIVGVHATKSAAYAQALAAQQGGSSYPEADYFKRVRDAMPRTLVTERFRKDPKDLVRSS